ncbi:MAG: chromate resistance protein ChrB domain-containing protein [Candidatus Acidiferrales bacterium]
MKFSYSEQGAPWLLLTFTLPGKRASQRVEIWRKLRRYGAIPLGNSGYLLPNDATNQERLEWLATSLRNYGGEASVIRVQAIDNLNRQQLIGRFSQARSREYHEIIRQLQGILSGTSTRKSPTRVVQLRNRFQEIVSIDFFGNPLQARVQELLKQAERTSSQPVVTLVVEDKERREYAGKVWVTRSRPGIDRCASAWLIRKFIDSKARFAFVPEGGIPPKRAVPFDMFEGGFGHRGEDCTFETLAKSFRVTDKRVLLIAQIIHDADLLDGKFGRREGFGIDEVLKGWARQGIPDKQLLDRGMGLIEGLYHSLAQKN